MVVHRQALLCKIMTYAALKADDTEAYILRLR